MLDFLFGKNEKREILDWLEEHDTPSYHGFFMVELCFQNEELKPKGTAEQ